MEQDPLFAILETFDSQLRSKLEGDLRLVHYTSAENAYRIISGGEVWLRSASVMNDYSEIEHGLRCLRSAWRSTAGMSLQEMLRRINDELVQQIEGIFDGNAPNFRHDTFIMSLSEHESAEDEIGRLSMWRAYGGNAGVALVLNTKAFYSDTQVMRVFSAPVRYQYDADFVRMFEELVIKILNIEEILSGYDPVHLTQIFYHIFRLFVIGTKHPGFKEEKEWRIFTSPTHEGTSEWLRYDIQSVRGIPQHIAKLKLMDNDELGVTGVAPAGLINRVIVGPCEHPYQIRSALIDALERQGVTDAFNIVWMSLIPLRDK